MNRNATLYAQCSGSDLSTRRGLSESDIADFVRLVRDNPRKTVRVYSSRGFVPNSYRYPCKIERITRDGRTGRITVDFGDRSL